MRALAVILLLLNVDLATDSPARADSPARTDSRGDQLARWLDQRGREIWGEPPPRCDDLTFARRVFLDVLGRVPSVAEIRDYQAMGDDRRNQLVEQTLFGEGSRAASYDRLSAQNLARHWRRVLVPPGTTSIGDPRSIDVWLSDAFMNRMPYDQIMSRLTRVSASDVAGQSYYQLLGSLPENYAGHLSRVMLGVRIECAQCHDHPFTDWKQTDFWGLAAFYSDLPRTGDALNASLPANSAGSIEYQGSVYPAKLLWSDQPMEDADRGLRNRLAEWITATNNANFASTGVNRVWQYLVGHGLYADVENLDLATPQQRQLLDELGQRFADNGYDLHALIAAICKTSWYQAQSVDPETAVEGFARTLKVISPEQVFDSLEQALWLPIGQVDPESPRWSGEGSQLVNRLSETVGSTPEDYAAGIPQALLLMNGKMTSDAIDLERSRLLRAVVESPFLDQRNKIETLYLAVLTRQPSREESIALSQFLNSKTDPSARQRAYGEILWALLNSPEFVLCR